MVMIAGLVAMSPGGFAQDAPAGRTAFSIAVDVLGDDSGRNLVKSFIGKALRALPDVRIVDRNPDWVVHIVVVDVKLEGGFRTGFGISTVILEPFRTDRMAPFPDRRCRDCGLIRCADLYGVKKHMINIASFEDVEKVCAAIVADLNREYLQIRRRKKPAAGPAPEK